MKILFYTSIFLFFSCFQSTKKQSLNNSVIDLTEYNLSNEIPFNLSEGWEMYWMELYTPKDFELGKVDSKKAIKTKFIPWSNETINSKKISSKGYATYRIQIKVPINENLKEFSVYYSHVFSASKLFINKKLIHEKGKVSSDLNQMKPIRTNSYADFFCESEMIEIILQISNLDHYRGGPRANFLFSTKEQMKIFHIKNYFLEMFIFGLIFGILIYHFFIYLVNRKLKAFLYFSILCLTFLIRIPILNSKFYEYFFPIPNIYLLSGFLHYLNIASFISGNLFLNSLFKIKKFEWINKVFFIGACISLFSPFLESSFAFYFNFAYVTFFLILFIFQSVLYLVINKQNKRSFYLMGFGIFGFAVLAFFAILVNFEGMQGGLYLILAYMIYAVFQSLFLSNYLNETLERNSLMKIQFIEENQKTLHNQRTDMHTLLHDKLGAGLTDLKVIVERKLRYNQKSSNPFLKLVLSKIENIITSLRIFLLQIEDLNYIYENFLEGINLTLLRRYSNAGRDFNFIASDSAEDYFLNLTIYSNLRVFFLNVYYILNELATNDLKYGKSESNWFIDVIDNNLFIKQSNQIKKSSRDKSFNLKSINKRLSAYNGNIQTRVDKNLFQVELQVIIPDIENQYTK